MAQSNGGLASCIEAVCLDQRADHKRVAGMCDMARTHGFAAVTVHSSWLPLVVDRLAGTSVFDWKKFFLPWRCARLARRI